MKSLLHIEPFHHIYFVFGWIGALRSGTEIGFHRVLIMLMHLTVQLLVKERIFGVQDAIHLTWEPIFVALLGWISQPVFHQSVYR